MFIQFIEGPVGDADAWRRQVDTWHRDLAADADGWLGTMAGVTDDGTGFLAARFESEAAARRNADREEQGRWWADTEACFVGPVDFTDCTDVELMRDGGADDAGFVQVIRGRVDDLDAARAMLEEAGNDDLDRHDVIGGYLGSQPDGAYTQVVYFTSEAEAREGERREAAAGDEWAERMNELQSEPPRFLDFRDPWLSSP